MQLVGLESKAEGMNDERKKKKKRERFNGGNGCLVGCRSRFRFQKERRESTETCDGQMDGQTRARGVAALIAADGWDGC